MFLIGDQLYSLPTRCAKPCTRTVLLSCPMLSLHHNLHEVASVPVRAKDAADGRIAMLSYTSFGEVHADPAPTSATTPWLNLARA